MGAWGMGVFEDDSALDWVWELEESSGTDLLQTAFDTVNQAQYREASDCSNGLAAAEVVAAMLGNPMEGLPEGIHNWLKTNTSKVDKKLQASAWSAVDHILVESELKELWEESEHYEEWQGILNDLTARLTVTQ